MPKSENQKLKLLYLQKILLEQTDEQHPLSAQELIAALARYDVLAERKSIYNDIDALRRYGLDIPFQKARPAGYYVAARPFELPELKLLADAVASSKFITEKKSAELIKKIEGLASVHEARQLQRQVFVSGRVKTMNEKIYYNVDTIHQAIAQNRQITFLYYEYNVNKTKSYRHGGEQYRASPYALTWDDENYYMIAYYEKYPASFSHFRVDKMERIGMLEEKRLSPPDRKAFNPAEYAKKVFNMFGGEEERVKLQFDNTLIGVVIDRFGKEVSVYPANDKSFIVNVDALISPTLLGWLFSFGEKVKILEPLSLIEKLRRQAAESLAAYGKDIIQAK